MEELERAERIAALEHEDEDDDSVAMLDIILEDKELEQELRYHRYALVNMVGFLPAQFQPRPSQSTELEGDVYEEDGQVLIWADVEPE